VITHHKDIEIRWRDTSASGRIGPGALVTFFEEARDEWLEVLCDSREMVLDFVVRRIEIESVLPLAYADDRVQVEINLQSFGTTSIVLDERIYAVSDGRLAATNTCVVVHVGPDKSAASPLPESVRQALIEHSGEARG
jgi:YbgC/YbaW family acyl-CoA thioester hydrolase